MIATEWLGTLIEAIGILTCLWYLNLRCTLRDLGVIQKFNNNDNDDEDQYRCQWW